MRATSFLPPMQIHIRFRRRKFVFSELDERSIALAEESAEIKTTKSSFPANTFCLPPSPPPMSFSASKAKDLRSA